MVTIFEDSVRAYVNITSLSRHVKSQNICVYLCVIKKYTVHGVTQHTIFVRLHRQQADAVVTSHTQNFRRRLHCVKGAHVSVTI